MVSLQDLLGLVREEIIRQKKCVPDKHDPSLQPYEAYKVDFDYFKILFAALSPWGKGEMAESLAARIFTVFIFTLEWTLYCCLTVIITSVLIFR